MNNNILNETFNRHLGYLKKKLNEATEQEVSKIQSFIDNNQFLKGKVVTEKDLIEKIKKHAYVHHIERLMYLSNWMLMNNIHPKEVYRIFMEWAIDAYEWVMFPNIFGMGIHSVGTLMMNRPYFSSSNYIFKMSNYKKSDENTKIKLAGIIEEYSGFKPLSL